MSANFYHVLATMRGVDRHHFQMLSPNPADAPKGARVDGWMYYVSANHAASNDPGKVAETVTADGKCMIREGFTIHNVDHTFFPVAPPHPYEFIEQRKIIKSSESTPFLTRASVTSYGDSLAVCSVGAIGANLNCHDSGMVLSGVVYCACTVVTEAQVAEVLDRLFDEIKKIFAELLPKLLELLARRYKWFGRIPRAVVDWVTETAVPWVIDQAKDIARKLAEAYEKLIEWPAP